MNKKAGSEIIVNLDSHLPKKICGICLIENPLNMMKNVFYFGLKALFVFKIFQFLSRHFGLIGKTVWLET